MALGAPAFAASDAPHIEGRALGFIWVVPFIGILLSIAIMPLALPRFWHHHFGKVAIGWALAFLVPAAVTYGLPVTAYEFLHTVLLEYIPFIILLLALFTVAGGIRVTGGLIGTPAVNTLMLAIGTVLASFMGTTGAAMLMIRPVMRANAWRQKKVHVIVFFIFLVANIGGSLTPLGDPPLFLGFLKGVPFFWTFTHLMPLFVFCGVILLALFYGIDSYLYRRESAKPPARTEKLGIEGGVNFALLGCIVGAVLLSGVWNPDVHATIYHIEIDLQNVVRDLLLLAIAFVSLKVTSGESRQANDFSWGPILEVAKLFIGIFITIIPAIAILRAGKDGALSGIINMVTDGSGRPIDAMYFWLTGILSSFLDNAPTYLVFFNTAGGDPVQLTTTMASTLLAISAGAVFMGANTYIGNAPNFMVKAIAEQGGIAMPSFFGYMAWSVGILIPLFILVTLIFFG